MRAVNLLPHETGPQKLGFDYTILIAMASILVVAAAVAGGFYVEKVQAGNQRDHLAVVQAELAQAQIQDPSTNSPAPAQLQAPVVLSQQQPWHVALDAAISSRVAWDVLLQQLEYVVPDKVTLTTVSVGSADATTGTSGGAITIGGNAFSAADIGVFLSTLTRVPNLSQVTLVSSAVNGGTSVIAFQITAQMAVPSAPAATSTDTTATTTTTTGGAG
jgi:Tfp pilus assembly protein PilN